MTISSGRGIAISERDIFGQSHSLNCTRIKDLGYSAGKRLDLYGEHFQMISDPFAEGRGVAVLVTSENDPLARTILLPVSIPVGPSDLLP